MIATERTNSGLLAFVSSGLRAFGPSRLHAFTPSRLRVSGFSTTQPSSLLNFGTAYSLYNSASTVRHSDYILQHLLHLILHLHSQSQQSVIKPRRC